MHAKAYSASTPAALQSPRVIWISGFSASGKTTVGRRVEALLRDGGVTAIFLDGDDLRSIFAQRWGYSREERIDLARVYFRLCSHLATQGVTVVISAVAMYDDVRRWLKDNVPAAVEVYLDVPERERRDRDRATKDLYGQIGAQATLYDEPSAPDLVVANHGEVTSDEAARQILAHVQSREFSGTADHGRSAHWSNFYANASAPQRASTFALAVAEEIAPADELLEVGCGNGRDAAFFASRGNTVVAIDMSAAAVAACEATHTVEGLTFVSGDIARLAAEEASFDVVYSRFCLHAMTAAEEDEFLARSAELLRTGGRLFIEARSINDPLAREGEVISGTERIAGHYRRFIVADELRAKLKRGGFHIDAFIESAGVAKLGDDDPVVIRASASVR
jgi:adenylylsulfate kinase-like enzyme/SAM-dependent methyltransferase